MWAEIGPCSVHCRDVLQRDQTHGAFLARAGILVSGGDTAIPQMAHNLWVLRVEFGGCCHQVSTRMKGVQLVEFSTAPVEYSGTWRRINYPLNSSLRFTAALE